MRGVRHVQGWVFEVDSRSNPGSTYLVDLGAEPEEMCQCKHWYCKAAPAIQKGGDPMEHACPHITAVALHLLFKEIIPKTK